MSGHSLRRFLEELGYVVHTPSSVFGRERLSTTLEDSDWLPIVGSHGWVVFGRDQHILDRPVELEAYLAAKVHMFMLPGTATRDQIIALVSTNLREVCTLAVARTPNVYWLRLRVDLRPTGCRSWRVASLRSC
jgi:hypothetical protein